ncbi:MAG: sigma-70 family RNA polymerase sigma factor [Candidatus Latescibacteria bacterium]|nr:sigma-70 family RNA polymerase sigma factor [Candidatus Latescibacterota bacterium]
MDPLEYYGLVVYLARQKHTHLVEAGVFLEVDDLIQEGFLGLLDALRRFDQSRGVSFSTFAYPRIAGAIDDYLRRQDLLPQALRTETKQAEAARGHLAQALGREPEIAELAEVLALAEDRVAATVVVPWSRAGRWEDAACLPEAWSAQGDHLLVIAVEECMQHALDPVERQVLLLRYGEELTLRKTGELVGRPVQTVFNIELRAKRKLRECLESRGLGLREEKD